MANGSGHTHEELRQVASNLMEQYAVSGDADTFSQLYDIVAPLLWRYCCRRLPPQCAEDVMQQTLLRMHQARGTFRAGADVYPWMFRIAYNLAIDCVRHNQATWRMVENYEPPLNGTGLPDDRLEAQETLDRICAVMDELPERQRAAFEFVHGAGLTHEQTAEAMGATESATRTLVSRALKAIREAIEGARE